MRFILGGNEDSWICYDGEWIKHGNPAVVMKPKGSGICATSVEAESMGLKNTLEKLFDLDLQGKIVVYQCDCIAALTAPMVLSVLTELLKRGAAKATVKHVKGHSGTNNPRSAVNHNCDKIAGEEMNKQRNTLR